MGNYSYDNTKYIRSINYKIGQEIESCRLMQGYTQKDLANKIGTTYQEIDNYEWGCIPIPIEKFYAIAKALSVSVKALLPRPTVLREGNRFKDEVEEILDLIRRYKKTKNQELRKTIYTLTQSIQAIEERNVKAARIEMAKNLLRAEFAVDIIYRATGLSADEYDNTEEEIRTDSADYKVGQRIKEVRLIRRYTQEDLANKIGISQQQIQRYEQGVNRTLTEKLYAIAKAFSVKVEVLLPEIEEGCCEGEDSKTEKELSSLIREYQKIKG